MRTLCAALVPLLGLVSAAAAQTIGKYADVHGLKMYYEIDGTGDPLVYIPNAFGFAGLTSFPALAQGHSVISVDLQGHGRTADIPERPLSIEQYAEDVVALLTHLGIDRADFFGATLDFVSLGKAEVVCRSASPPLCCPKATPTSNSNVRPARAAFMVRMG